MMAGSIKDVANTYTQLKDRQIGSKQSMGRNTGEGMLVYTGLCGLKLYTMSITRTSAKSIDDYFTKYGYATRRLKIPNRNSRPHWNYVKTIGMELNNNECPTDDARKICAIYDKGITFWKNASEVGDYSLDNSPQ